MKANNHVRNSRSNDEGVSPVIAVILMVAITVVLAATVYVWVSGFSSDDSGPESAQVRASSYDSDGDGAADWIRLTLLRGENAPYSNSIVNLTVITNAIGYNDNAATPLLCSGPTDTGAAPANECDASVDWVAEDASTDAGQWAVGEVMYLPCKTTQPHQLTLTIRSSVVLDSRISCDQVAQ